MSLEPAPQRQRRANRFTRFLTKTDLCRRYGWKTPLSVDRAWKEYRSLPAPTRYLGRRPLWAEHILDAHDAAHQFDADA
jgi:hypothetical protein